MIKRIYVFDIDGVLLDSSHRFKTDPVTHKIDLPYWIENCTPEKVAQDVPLPTANLYKKLLLNPSAYVIIATARVMAKADWQSIEKHLGMPNHFIHRKAGDMQSGVTLKGNALKRLFTLKQYSGKMVTFFEDNIDYLHGLTKMGLIHQPVYIHSKQGV